MNKKLVLLGTAFLMGVAAVSAQKRVTGRVVDTDGQPVIGASVRVEGEKGVAVTDDNGNFTLNNVSASAKELRITYIGKKAQTVSIAANVRVVMEDDDNVLGEAVVVGYGSAQKLGTVVGAVSTVSGDKIAYKPAANALDGLQGTVSGLQVLSSSGDPGAAITSGSYSATIRGIGSLSDNTPLFVVDGVPTSSSVLGMMNPADIANVTVLKGASATSIYGSRAANGVIYITTKRGRSGEKARVTISQSIGWTSLARRIGDPMTAIDFLDYEREMGVVTGADYYELKKQGYNTDWQDYQFDKNVPMYETNFSISGGNDRTTYYASASHFKQDGIVRGSRFKRITFRSNIDSKPLDWLGYGVNISLSYDERAASNATYNGSNYVNGGVLGTYMQPSVSPYGPNGERLNQYGTPVGQMNSPEYMAWGNPVFSNDLRTLSSAYLQLTPVKGLTIRSQLSLDALETRGASKVMPSYSPGNGRAQETFSRMAQFTITNTAEYKFTINELHNITLLAGQEGIRTTSKGFGAMTNGQSLDNFVNLGAGLVNSRLPSYSEYKYEYLSFFGRADYSYADKYYVNFTVRNDKSSRFGHNNQAATFFSGGVMWNMKSEDFLSDVDWLDNLQVRADVGSTGNSAVGNYDHLALGTLSRYGGTQAYYFSQLANEDLTWETQVQTSIGFDARLFDRIDFSFGWYNRDTKDMLQAVPTPYTTGFSSVVRNVGSMNNRGIEIEFGVDLVKTKDFYLNVHGNYSYNKNKFTELFNGLDQYYWPGTSIIYKVGESANYYMPIYAGVDKNTGEQMWYKQGYKGEPGHDYNPETMTKDFVESDLLQDTGKSHLAPHTGGFGLTASWKGLTLTADFSFVLGKWMVNNDDFFSNNPAQFITQLNQDYTVTDVWRNPGDLTLEPAFGSVRQFDTHLLENASFMRLKNLTLSYDLPEQWMRATGFISGVRITATGRNLFTVTKYTGVDPEINSNIAMGAYPNTRQYTLGVQVMF